MTQAKPTGDSSQSNRSKNRLKTPLIVAAATLIGAGVVGGLAGESSKPAQAQSLSERIQNVVPFPGAPASFADLVERVRPSVVSINVKNGRLSSRLQEQFRGLPDLPEDHPFNEFFKRFSPDPRGNTPRNRRPSLAQGSGFIISKDGYVVTNHHVIDNASEISVTLDGGDKIKAKLIGSDQRTDLALLKIESDRTFPAVKFADKEARVGDWVLAVGNPFGLGGTVTAGIVSARGRDIGSGPYDYLQIDAAVNRGNSGGPTFNLRGEVVGVNTAIFSPSGGNVGIAFAVPADLTRTVVNQLQDTGSVSRGWLGVTIQNVTEDIADSLGLDKPQGAMISKLSDKGPAEKAGLQTGDTIVEVNGEEIRDSRDLARKIASLEPTKDADITIYRDGRRQTVPVELGQFPGLKQLAKVERSTARQEREMESLGLTLSPATGTRGLPKDGVVITKVDTDSRAAEKGLKAGDVIMGVGGKDVQNPRDVEAGVKSARDKGRKAVLLRIQSGSEQRFIALPLEKKAS